MLLALVGPTASGKTRLGIRVAERLDAEVCSVDSMLVYRGMDIGTAKPTQAERERMPHHLIDLADPGERFTVARFQREGHRVLPQVPRPLLVGGSGLYFRALVDELALPPEDPGVRARLEAELAEVGAGAMHERLVRSDPAAAAKIGPANARRTVRALEVQAVTGRAFSSFGRQWDRQDPSRVRAVGLAPDREDLVSRIGLRVREMLDRGWLDEVRALVERGFEDWFTSTQAIGYAELAHYVTGDVSLDEAVDATVRRTKNLARRQLAWFRRDPRIRWIASTGRAPESLTDEVASILDPIA